MKQKEKGELLPVSFPARDNALYKAIVKNADAQKISRSLYIRNLLYDANIVKGGKKG